MNRKMRTLATAVLAGALALPAIASSGLFSDVPADHPRADDIAWASRWPEGAPLFRGFPDGNFRPDRELTEAQFQKVVQRLFDAYDSWTRAETARFLRAGHAGLAGTPSATIALPRTSVTAAAQVASVYDKWGNFTLLWLRPGAYEMDWEFRVLADDGFCPFLEHDDEGWMTGGDYNGFKIVDGIDDCVLNQTFLYTEVRWEDGVTAVSERCRAETDTQGWRRWKCHEPPGWETWRR